MTQHSPDAIAAWESATVQNLGPLLTENDSAGLWSALLAHRDSGDANAFASAAREIGILAGPRAAVLIESAIAALDRPPSAPSPAARAAHEE